MEFYNNKWLQIASFHFDDLLFVKENNQDI